jgi:hypothetical protein
MAIHGLRPGWMPNPVGLAGEECLLFVRRSLSFPLAREYRSNYQQNQQTPTYVRTIAIWQRPFNIEIISGLQSGPRCQISCQVDSGIVTHTFRQTTRYRSLMPWKLAK